MKRIGMVAGSFDPITNGHQWLIEQALEICDKVYVVVGNNPAKKYLFSEYDRGSMVKAVFEPHNAVKRRLIVTNLADSLLINVAAELGCNFLIRGIRNSEDFNYESQVHLINRKIQPTIETVFLIPPRELTEVSSSTVKGLVGFKGWEDIVSTYVHPVVLEALRKVRK
jgi:pantetheine-phosphate adenylyltransferase